MWVKKALLENLRVERRLTRETIAAMSDSEVQFRPTDEQMSFGEQALHVISAQETLLDGLQGKGWVWERETKISAYPTQTAILAKFDEVVATEHAYYESLADADFGRMIPNTWGPPEPVLQLIVSFLAHEAHHRGQMVAYLRLKGITPPKY
ncbi:MAG: DinB family protein [Mycobacterium leprae]